MTIGQTQRKLLLYNPMSGVHRGLPKIDWICRQFAKEGWDVIPQPTTGPRTAAGIVEKFAPQIDGVLVVGGDGTINETLPAMAHSSMFLGVLPGGTANVLAHELNTPKKLPLAIPALVHGKVRRVTLGEANGRFFISMAGVGFDALVASRVPLGTKRLIGKGAFVGEAFRQIIGYRFPLADFRFEGESFKASLGIISNTTLYGGDLVMAPKASLEDPSLDLCLFLAAGRWRFVRYLLSVLRQRHIHRPDVFYRKIEQVEIAGDTSIPYQLDGEPAGHLPLVVRSHPNALGLIFPDSPQLKGDH